MTKDTQTCRHRCTAVTVCILLFLAQSSLSAQSEIGLRLQIVQGDRNQNSIGQPVAVPIAVRVTDRDNRPIPGATVVFTAPDKGASGDFDGEHSYRLLTNESGLATVRNYRPNRIEGRYPVLVQAEYMGELATGILVQTNVAEKKSRGKMIAIAAAAGGAVGAALLASRSGSGGSNSPTPTVSVPSITFGGASVSGPR